ncbi:sugar transferase [Allorhodopirellula solitaria]|uniref:UDP-N-acetylgalactosamine-undecaprenyl-phosphate N-acetylgalactosaminephosphotransferase n=1 Tax=Allorhodopirellula solitaria TaxID=2527987 RepID=A0A5C5X0Y6_9BACT|nr:sugar transferase [Allorhodopirellula solitaria]TWT55872.1 UDP-N-acetylgalactosamine-undecaprenyl-phosphate N-acetylgalactosaminephosphotransferase [Allorhodopirellula solitaria]
MSQSSFHAAEGHGGQAAQEDSSIASRKHELLPAPSSQLAADESHQGRASVFPVRVDRAHEGETAADAPSLEYFSKRYIADRIVGAVLLVLFSPVILALYLIVRATSHGPGFYKQVRVGLNEKPFEIVKLRSMVLDAEKPGQPQWSVKGDSRVNWVGRVLRKLHLDELPQLLNVTRGDMSLVGPRPERPQICEGLAAKIPGYYGRNAVKPGVTGLAQINLPPDESLADVRRKQILDLHYIENASLWLDVRMVVATALRMVGIKGGVVMDLMRLDRTNLTKGVQDPAGKEQLAEVSLARAASRSESTVDMPTRLQFAGADDSTCHSLPNHPR